MSSKVIRQCSICGKTFETVITPYHNKRFCSRDCARTGSRTRDGACCDNCGKIFERRPSHRLKHVFCSRECWTAYSSRDIRGAWSEIIGLYSDGKSVKDIAGELGVKSGRLMYWVKKLWKDEKLRRSYHYGLKFSTYPDPTTRKAWHVQARKKLEDYRKKCAVCGWDKDNCDLHAINNGEVKIGNLVSLCPNCHRLLHRGKLKLSQDIVRSARKLAETNGNNSSTSNWGSNK